MSFKINEQIWF